MARGWPAWSIILVILAIVTAGCQQGSSPAPPLCELLVDYDEVGGVLWFYLSGVQKVRFDHLSLALNESRISQPNVYSLQHNFSDNPVVVEAMAVKDGVDLMFKATITFHDEEGKGPYLIIDDGEGEKPLEEALPFSTYLEKVVEV